MTFMVNPTLNHHNKTLMSYHPGWSLTCTNTSLKANSLRCVLCTHRVGSFLHSDPSVLTRNMLKKKKTLSLTDICKDNNSYSQSLHRKILKRVLPYTYIPYTESPAKFYSNLEDLFKSQNWRKKKRECL